MIFIKPRDLCNGDGVSNFLFWTGIFFNFKVCNIDCIIFLSIILPIKCKFFFCCFFLFVTVETHSTRGTCSGDKNALQTRGMCCREWVRRLRTILNGEEEAPTAAGAVRNARLCFWHSTCGLATKHDRGNAVTVNGECYRNMIANFFRPATERLEMIRIRVVQRCRFDKTEWSAAQLERQWLRLVRNSTTVWWFHFAASMCLVTYSMCYNSFRFFFFYGICQVSI